MHCYNDAFGCPDKGLRDPLTALRFSGVLMRHFVVLMITLSSLAAVTFRRYVLNDDRSKTEPISPKPIRKSYRR